LGNVVKRKEQPQKGEVKRQEAKDKTQKSKVQNIKVISIKPLPRNEINTRQLKSLFLQGFWLVFLKGKRQEAKVKSTKYQGNKY